MIRSELLLPTLLAVLLGIGFLTLSSAVPTASDFMRQLAFFGLSLLAAAGVLYLGRTRILSLAYPLYGLTLLLLVLVYFFGAEVNGARSWLKLGPFGFQPSELAKLSLILVLTSLLGDRPVKSFLDYLLPTVAVLLPFTLIFLEPDLGTALVILAIGAGMLLVRGIPVWHMILFVVILAVSLPLVAWPNLKPHQKDRIVAFVNPSADPQGSGYQVIQSRIAIGSGGLWGKGYKKGTQSQLGFIPFRNTDFIFPVLAEEGGLFSSLFLLLFYGLLFWRLASMAFECSEERDQLIIVGVLTLISFQVLVNIGGALGLAPVAGITLPLMSQGGSSLLSTLVALSMAFVAHRDRYRDW